MRIHQERKRRQSRRIIKKRTETKEVHGKKGKRKREREGKWCIVHEQNHPLPTTEPKDAFETEEKVDRFSIIHWLSQRVSGEG